MEYRGVRIETCEGVYSPCDDTFLLAEALEEELRPGDRVLEVGTGTGLLAILAARRAGRVLAVDVSDLAVECARRNVAANGVDNVEVRKSDLFSRVTGKFDLVIFNPPYLPSEDLEPEDDLSRAWDGGRDGRRVTERFVRECPGYLRQGGRVLLVQSSLSAPEKTREMFLRLGFEVSVVAEKRFFFERLCVIRAVQR
ncbi:MAG: methyltransferase [Euryarchaeota archaeon]|nr:methyltransferase [Euryarchaeota archaeon]